jgi:hypothetical protein
MGSLAFKITLVLSAFCTVESRGDREGRKEGRKEGSKESGCWGLGKKESMVVFGLVAPREQGRGQRRALIGETARLVTSSDDFLLRAADADRANRR